MNETSYKGERSCAVCGGEKKRLLFRQHFSTLSTGSLLEGYDVVACQGCGFCFADHIPEQAAFDVYYQQMSKYEYQNQGRQKSKYDVARFQTIASILKPFMPHRQTRILEIGCATGHLLSLLQQSGYENVLGIDPAPACAEAANKLYGVRVMTNTLSNAVVNDQSVDFMILAGVFEHVRDLGTTLPRLGNMLSADGQIYVAVPDASRYAEGEDAPFQEFSVEHINFFGPTSLANLMRANGFSQILCQQSLMEANYRTTTPVIHAIFKKDATHPSSTRAIPDTQTEPGLMTYINQSRQVDAHIHAIINDIAASGRPIIVWGTGAHTLRLLATSRLAEAKISAFVDSNSRYQGKMLSGISIIAPADLRDRPEPILISSRVFQQEIERQIRDDLQCSNQVILLYQL